MSEKNKLYIANLDYSVTSEELNEYLKQNWEVVDCKVIEGKGFGFVTFANSEAAESAKEALTDQEFKGRAFRVDFARDNKFGGGGGGGGGGGRRNNSFRENGGGGGRRRY